MNHVLFYHCIIILYFYYFTFFIHLLLLLYYQLLCCPPRVCCLPLSTICSTVSAPILPIKALGKQSLCTIALSCVIIIEAIDRIVPSGRITFAIAPLSFTVAAIEVL